MVRDQGAERGRRRNTQVVFYGQLDGITVMKNLKLGSGI
jgi:hypothetical protein